MDLAETKRETIEAANPVGRPKKGEEKTSPNLDEFPNDRRTDAKVGKIAGVSRHTVMKYRAIKKFGDDKLVDGLR
jgi:hypothetical protein